MNATDQTPRLGTPVLAPLDIRILFLLARGVRLGEAGEWLRAQKGRRL